MSELTQERLKELLHYDPETGVFTWLVNRGSAKAGMPTSGTNRPGYVRVRVDGELYYAHRLAFLYMTGSFPDKGLHTDHINRDRSDNRWENLRCVTRSINFHNSGAAGCSFHKAANKWQAAIMVNKERTYLGLFDTKEEAVAAYRQAKTENNLYV